MVSWENSVSQAFVNSHMAYLMSKLIAGYTQNNESLGGVARVKLVHLSIIPDCCSSKRRHILNENNFAPQRRNTAGFTRQQFNCHVVKPFHISSHSRE